MKRFLLILTFTCDIIALSILIINLRINIGTESYIYQNTKDAPTADTVIVPGAAVLPNGALTTVLQDRADTAIELYTNGKVSKILVSGDNSTENYNEVSPVRNYLLKNSIPDEDIFLDHAGFDTYSTMYRARDIFKVSSILIATQSFHLPRAVFIARELGMDANGVVVDSGRLRFRNYVREVLANEKAVLNLLFHRKPKYLGDEIPIQDG